jgi:hypothetical protein
MDGGRCGRDEGSRGRGVMVREKVTEEETRTARFLRKQRMSSITTRNAYANHLHFLRSNK